MAPARAPSTPALLRARATARIGLLGSATATVAVAVATLCTLVTWLLIEVRAAGDAAPPGVAADDVAAQVEAGIIALVSAAPALVLLVAIIAATAAAQLARLLAAAREQETANARARGLSQRQALAANAVEAGAIAVAGAVAGLGIAALVLAIAAPAGSEWAGALVSLWWVAAATAAVLGIVLVSARRRSAGAARGARATTAVVVVLVAAAAAFVLWQLRLARPAGFDPIAAVAPTVVLMAGSLVVLALFGAAAAAWSIAAAARPGLTPAYPARQVARRLPIYAVAVLLIGLTVAQAVFASAYSATWTAMVTDSAGLGAGADLRVDLEPSTASPGLVADAAAVEGVDAAAPALVVPIEIGSTDAELIALPTSAIGTVISDAGGIIDLEELGAAVAPAGASVAAAPVPLGPDATGLAVTAAIDPSRANLADSVAIVATVLDSTGTAAQLSLAGATTEQADGTVLLSAEAPLPAGTAPWALLAMTASIPPTFANATVGVRITDVGALGGEALAVEGEATLAQNAPEQVLWLADATPESVQPTPEPVEFAPVRAVLSADLAARLGIEVGEVLEFRYAGTGRRGAVEVAGIVDALPGASTGLALFMPLEALQVSMLQRGTSLVPPASVWAAGDPSAGAPLSGALGDRPVTRAAPGVAADVVGALVPAWWIATAGSAVLSLVAAFAIVQTLALSRRREAGVLRALGIPHGRQARTRAAELSAVLAASVVLGALAGMLVAWLLVPELVRAVTPGVLPLGGSVSLAWPGLVLALGVLVAGLAVIVIVAARGVDRAARAATVGEDAR